ncbi:hypothetical protein L1987_48136 [Smallanthus sonchifolius]|uniref:Uncharacterized protein n=1 Tax=Smallanthus sonchifolius TaxID=185202 RepID=A0ACB9FS78_9ASTR|nr:hypothetical protein L1987_48136 [Smallanthus sonchifolius]
MPPPPNTSASSHSDLKIISASSLSDRLDRRTPLATTAARTTKPSPTNNVCRVLPSFTTKDLGYFPVSPTVVVAGGCGDLTVVVFSLLLNNEPKLPTLDFMDFIICLFELREGERREFRSAL